jgi:hypothetical protein
MKLPVSEAARLLTTEQAAELLAVKARVMVSWRRLGRGPAYVRMNPSCVRYRMDKLIEFQDAMMQEVGVTG